jgi:adenylate cyclase
MIYKFRQVLVRHLKQSWFAMLLHFFVINLTIVTFATNFASGFSLTSVDYNLDLLARIDWFGWAILSFSAICLFNLALIIQNWKFDIISFTVTFIALWILEYFAIIDGQTITQISFIAIANVSITSSARQVLADRQSRIMRKIFGRYVNHEILDDLLTKPVSKLTSSGSQREMTVMFSDIRGFTALSEKLAPKDLIAVLNKYLTGLSKVISQQEGTIDKFIGDAVMAFWNAPFPQRYHATRAVKAAVLMIQEVERLNLTNLDGLQLKLGIGINTGKMVVGSVGSSTKLDYTVLGDNVNLGARLEGLCKRYQVPILVSHNTMAQAKVDKVIFRLVDNIIVKGKTEAVKIYQPVIDNPANRSMIDYYHKGLHHYQKGEFYQAIQLWTEIATRGDSLAAVMITRARKLDMDFPKAWDGVWRWDEK